MTQPEGLLRIPGRSRLMSRAAIRLQEDSRRFRASMLQRGAGEARPPASVRMAGGAVDVSWRRLPDAPFRQGLNAPRYGSIFSG
jgi:hypothetical protein